MKNKPELLMPAGDFQKLKYAFAFGADAVYLGGKNFSLRARANNFEPDEIKDSVNYAHALNKKIYVTVNAFFRNVEIPALEKYLKFLEEIKVDAIILSDPGILFLAKKIAPNLELHLSVQANTTNELSCKFWQEAGIKRIVLARELNISEISEIVKSNENLEFEVFIHGAMCISYSGRCFLSAYFANRDANRGDCAHPCRWKYKILEEEKRPGKMIPYEEDEKGAYLFNVNDMCLINRISELVSSGVQSFKVEGRMKSLYYLTATTRLYRRAIDLFFNDENDYFVQKEFLNNEMEKLNNRGYTEGFYFGTPEAKDYNYDGEFDKITHYFLAQISEKISDKKVRVIVKNNIKIGDFVEILTPNEFQKNVVKINTIFSLKDNVYVEKGHSDLEAILEFDREANVSEFSLLRATD